MDRGDYSGTEDPTGLAEIKMKTCCFLLVLISTQCLLDLLKISVSGAFYDDEALLRTAVLTDYQYKIRPASTVSVSVSLSLLNINVLDVTSQRLSVGGWLVFTWSDPRLTWTPAVYGGIENIYDTENVLWRPEVIVDNSVANLGVIESDKLLIRTSYQGGMTWEPPGIYETHCDVDVTFYPFDTQICMIAVTSWAYVISEVDLLAQNETINLDDFEESGEWDILSTWSLRHELTDGANTHSELKFYMRLQRKPAYYVTTIVIPVTVTAVLCILVFMLPVESGEKAGYSLTMLLTYTVMLTLVSSHMPPTSKHTSVLSVYLTIILFVGAISTMATLFVLFCHHQTKEVEIPQWLVKLTRSFLVPIACWKRPSSGPVAGNTRSSINGQPPNLSRVNKISPESKSTGNDTREDGQGNNNGRTDRTSSDGDDSHGNNDNDADHTWQEISVIIDCFCLRISGVFVAFLTVTVLLTMIVGGRL